MKNINLSIFCVVLIFINPLNAQKILTLEQSKQLALQYNIESKNSKLEIEASRQIRKSAFTNFFPQISAGGFKWEAEKHLMEMGIEGGNLPVYDGDPTNLATATQFAYFPSITMGLLKKGTIGYLNAVQPVFVGGRILNGNKLASLGVEVSEHKYKLAQNKILLKTEEQYWLIVSLEEKQKTIEKYEELLDRLQFQVEDAFNSGIVMKNDVLKVGLKLSEVQLNKSRLENGRKLATMAFCQYIGVPYDTILVLKEELKVLDNPQKYFIDNTEALKNRTEYSLLEISRRAEELQTSMKLGEFLPEAGIGVSGIYQKLDESEDRSLGMVYGTISVPISGWWGGAHELEERSIREKITENNYKNTSELLTLQMEKSWQDFNDAYKQYLLSEDAKFQAEENYKVNDDSFKYGLVAVSDLLEAQAMLQQAQDQLTDAITNYIMKKKTYLQVTGR